MNQTAGRNPHNPGWAELDPSKQPLKVTAADKKELKKKNLVVGLCLLAFVGLVFFVTIAKLSTNFGG